MALKKCKECGEEISSSAKVCPKCGKKQVSIINIICGVIAVIIIVGAITSVRDSDNTIPKSTNSNSEQQEEINTEGSGNIGKYHVEIKDYSITTDYSGNSILLVTYSFTNNDDVAKSFAYTLDDKAYQNGVEIKSPISTYGIEDYNWEDSTKEIQPGVTFDFNIGYQLSDTTSPVEVKVTTFLSSKNSPTITKTFNILE